MVWCECGHHSSEHRQTTTLQDKTKPCHRCDCKNFKPMPYIQPLDREPPKWDDVKF